AARLMMEKKIGGLPVVEEDKLVGIITESDIFRLVVKEYTE
ncbi:MAG: CBS domain-containing protein, partial [Anaerolineae bacterium]|nr:CBS domain-containing protein [Anaerolineae bacterium]